MPKDIKIFVSHRIDLDATVIKDSIYTPVRCGAVFDTRKDVDILGDDTGDNISSKRLSFCELTVQYWAWKNVKADYYGLCHYRRYLSFSDYVDGVNVHGQMNEPYIGDDFKEKFALNEKTISGLMERYDIISAKPIRLDKLDPPIRVYDSLVKDPFVFSMDIVDTYIRVFKEKYPEYIETIDEYFSGYVWKAYNCFIMKKELFEEYNELCFNVLFEVERQVDLRYRNTEQLRTIGYMGEATFGIFFLKKVKENAKSTAEFNLVYVENPRKYNNLSPSFKSNNIPIVLASSNEYIPYLSVTLESILNNISKENNYDFFILGSNITEHNRAIITTQVKHNRSNTNIRFIDANIFLSKHKLYIRDHVTVMTYLRLYILDLMCNYEKVVYLDCDIIVNEDVAKLFAYPLGDNYLGAVLDTTMAGWCNSYNSDQSKYNLEKLGIDVNFQYINAGVLVFNIKEFSKHYSSAKLLEIASSDEWRWFDQDVLNKVCYGHIRYISNEWNVMVHSETVNANLSEKYAPFDTYQNYKNAVDNPKIIHYAGNNMPTTNPVILLSDYFWKYARTSPYYEDLLVLYLLRKDFKSQADSNKNGLIYRIIKKLKNR